MHILRSIAALRPLYEGDPGGGGGNPNPNPQGGGQGGGNPNPNPNPASGDPAGNPANVQGLLQRHQGDAMAVIATLLSENHSLRDERRTLRGQLPAQGAVVLSSEDASRWQAYQQLGAVDALSQERQAAQAAQSELTTLKQDLLLRDVAALGDGKTPYKAAVLKQIAGNAQFVIKEADGKKSVVIKEPGTAGSGGDKETPIGDYAKAHWADFLPALVAQPERVAIGTPQVRMRPAGQGDQPPAQQQARKPVKF